MKRPQAIVIDIDGTIAIRTERKPFEWARLEEDVPNRRLVELLEILSSVGIKMLLVSGREERLRSGTERWLAAHLGPFEALFLRPSGDFRKDSQIKYEIFVDQIKDNYEVVAVFDDRQQTVDMWREELGLLCLQVAKGDF